MKNQETWIFAHQTCGKIWHRLGWILLVISVAGTFFVWNQEMEVASIWCSGVLLIQILILIATMVPVEAALDKTFDSDGKRKK